MTTSHILPRVHIPRMLWGTHTQNNYSICTSQCSPSWLQPILTHWFMEGSCWQIYSPTLGTTSLFNLCRTKGPKQYHIVLLTCLRTSRYVWKLSILLSWFWFSNYNFKCQEIEHRLFLLPIHDFSSVKCMFMYQTIFY